MMLAAAIREVGAGVCGAGEGRGVGPDRQFQVVLRILAPGRTASQ